MTIFLIILLLLILPVIYNILFPLKPPYLDNYFSPGEVFESKGEGVKQTILRQEGRKVFVELELGPKAAGPPEHMHLTFDENAVIKKGILTVLQNGVTTKLKAGDRIHLPAKQYHYFYNEMDEPVVIRCESDTDYVPVEFAYGLSQLYPYMEKSNKPGPSFFMKIAVLDDLFDVYPKDAPVEAFKRIKKVLKPYARVFGFSPYDNKSKPR